MKNKLIALIELATEKSALKKLVFSRPEGAASDKISARLCEIRGRKAISIEYSLPGNTVSQKNVSPSEIKKEFLPLFDSYKQVNLITSAGDAEWKSSKKGKEIALGSDKLLAKLGEEKPSFEDAIEALDKRKNYILTGKEDFLYKLGISDMNGRVHDKKQGKFRQINRFLEHVEDIYPKLSNDGRLNVFDLCCGKSYLSFALYYYLTAIKSRDVFMLGIDLKRDVISWCDALAKELSFGGMHFVYDDVKNTPKNIKPDLVISLHACDIATDIVINSAIELGAGFILSTPCCHRYLNDKLNMPSLSFVSRYPHLKNKLCEALTDGIRVARLRAAGYKTTALELTDPENTPKNTLIKAELDTRISADELLKRKAEYDAILTLALGDGKEDYLKEI